jgi:phosphoribosylformylglycinamidine cyclo-ligase
LFLTVPVGPANLPGTMADKKKIDYASAGVSLDAADEAVKRIKKLAGTTFTKNVLSDIGSFGGMFRVPTGYKDPVLVSSTDSVGTKLKLAFMSGIHTTVGQDIVNHCVNDILVQGAKPLFFMDYIAAAKVEITVVADLVYGLAKACRENDMPLLGGETAELPGFYQMGEYDLVGTIVGIVERKKIVSGARIADGDMVLGLPSVGLHTNGFSLARKICFEMEGLAFDGSPAGLDNSIGPELMQIHRSYYKPVMALLSELQPHGMAHITGGGIPGNLIRIIPDGLKAVLDSKSWPALPVFDFLQKAGGVDDKDMFDAFNMGIGYILVVGGRSAGKAEAILSRHNQPSYRIGRIVKGKRAVTIS